jgi:hypothetical protein
MDDDVVQGWNIVGLAVFIFLIGAVQSLSTEPKVAFICFIGVILAVDIGIVQIHIRGMV